MDSKRDNNMDRNTKDRPRVQKEGETVAHYAEDLEIWFYSNDVPDKFMVPRIIAQLNKDANQWATENFKNRKEAWCTPTTEPLGHVQKFLTELQAAMKETGLSAKGEAIDSFHTAFGQAAESFEETLVKEILRLLRLVRNEQRIEFVEGCLVKGRRCQLHR